jgi:hypothetical protein
MTDPPAVPDPTRDYAGLGERVTAVLNAAEEAAAAIRAEAASEAEAVRSQAAAAGQGSAEEERRLGAEEAERLVSSAIADAAAIREAAHAAASRVAEEGRRRLGELRDDARRLEGRFERAVDDLNDLIGQLDAVVQGAVERPEHPATSAADAPPGAPILSVVADPDTPPEADLEPEAELARDLRPRAPREAAPERTPDAPDDGGAPRP